MKDICIICNDKKVIKIGEIVYLPDNIPYFSHHMNYCPICNENKVIPDDYKETLKNEY